MIIRSIYDRQKFLNLINKLISNLDNQIRDYVRSYACTYNTYEGKECTYNILDANPENNTVGYATTNSFYQ